MVQSEGPRVGDDLGERGELAKDAAGRGDICRRGGAGSSVVERTVCSQPSSPEATAADMRRASQVIMSAQNALPDFAVTASAIQVVTPYNIP